MEESGSTPVRATHVGAEEVPTREGQPPVRNGILNNRTPQPAPEAKPSGDEGAAVD